MRKIAFISHSGGLDSTTILYKLLNDKIETYAINFDYGQNNSIEISSQNNIIEAVKQSSELSKYFLGNLKLDVSPVTNAISQVKLMQGDNSIIKENTGHEFYFPFRNLVFASLTSMIAETLLPEIKKSSQKIKVYIVLGIHKHTDVYSKQYWDVTPEFADAMNVILQLNKDFKDCEFEIYAPFKDDFKSSIVEAVVKYDVPWELTTTCYNPQRSGINYRPCLKCEACCEREAGAKESQSWRHKYGDPSKINQYILG